MLFLPSPLTSSTLFCCRTLIDTDQRDQKALVVKLIKVELNNAIESARRARQVNDNGEHVCGPDCPLRDSALRERQPISEELRGVA